MISATTFEPSHGIIIQNKDEIIVPLLTEQIPSARQFRDAIDSLSPEMQRFAKAYRAMQLEASMFALCVIQIKPQMENLLNLPYSSLTKQIRLTQDLMEMFITYQIPSDLMSYDEHPDAHVSSKISAVQGHIRQLRELIQEMKNKELNEKREEATYAVLNSIGGGPGGAVAYASRGYSSAGSSSTVSLSVTTSPHFRAQLGKVNAPAAAAQSAKQKADNQAALEAAQDNVLVDYTKLPAALDANLDTMARGSSIRPTTLSVSNQWQKKYQKALLAAPAQTTLGNDELHTERNRAFDLLDALSRSGALPFAHCALHVVIAATHCFDKSLMQTVTRDNINPIEKAECVSAVVCATLNGIENPLETIRDTERDRLKTYSPLLITNK